MRHLNPLVLSIIVAACGDDPSSSAADAADTSPDPTDAFHVDVEMDGTLDTAEDADALDADAEHDAAENARDVSDIAPDAVTDAADVAEDTVPDAADVAADSVPDTSTDADAGAGCVPAPATAAGQVRTEHVTVQGALDDGAWRWLAIPYAAPPVGELRWRPPEPPPCEEAVRDATAWGDACPQYDGDALIGAEDCLTLNVFAPDGEAPEGGWPVLVFVHGGGHVQGSAGQLLVPATGARLYDGRRLALDGPSVVVTLQYRLGALGWLAHPELEDADGSVGMWGALDQRAALQWVRDNVAAFGGDPDRVLLFGESAGGVSTCVHIASPGSAGLFHAAAIESATCTAEERATVTARHERLVGASRCGGEDDVAACLRGLDWRDVLTDLPGSPGLGDVRIGGGDESFGPLVDGVVLPDTPSRLIADGEGNDVPVIIGTNAAELESAWAVPVPTEEAYRALVRATFFVLGSDTVDTLLATYPASAYPTPRDAAVALWNDAQFNCITRRAASVLAAAHDAPVYHYWFTQVFDGPDGPVPPSHGNELPYVFGTLEDIPLLRIPEADLRVSEAMVGYWTHLASAGDPNGATAAVWTPWDVATQPSMQLEDPPATSTAVLPNCDVWDALYDEVGLP